MGVPCDSIHLVWVRFAESHISHTVGRYSPSNAKSSKFPSNARLFVCFLVPNIPWETNCNVQSEQRNGPEQSTKAKKRQNGNISRLFPSNYCFGISNFFKTSKKIVRCHLYLPGLSVIESRSLF